MHQKLRGTPRHWLRGLAGAGLLALASLSAQAQTTTVFSEDFEGATNSFTLENGGQNNQWVVAGTAANGPTSPGTKSAYISNDFGNTNSYNITSASVVHLYRDVTLPAGQSAMQLNFDWRAAGESANDYLLVQVAPTTFTPVAGTIPAATSATVLAQLNQQGTFARASLVVPASLAGTTQRLIFTWVNNAFGGTQPPALADNITLTARAAVPLSGAYTINSALPTAGTNFASFGDAATRLNFDGISGPVTLAVTGGPYTEQFLLGQVAGSSATNTLVVNGGGSTIRFASTNSNQRAVVQLNGTDYTTINNLVIDATGGAAGGATYGIGVLLTNAADNDQITSNTITADGSSTSSNFAGIAVNGSVANASATGNSANNLLVQGNTITGGYYGITLYGSSATAQNTGNILRNNIIRDFYIYGIYAGFQLGAQFVGNDIGRPLRSAISTFYGVYVSGQCNGLAIEKNRIHDAFTGNTGVLAPIYGIYLTGNGSTSTTPNDIVNNVVYRMAGGNIQYCVFSASNYSRIYNNTLTADDQLVSSTYAAYGIYSSGGYADIRNNVVSITRLTTGPKYGVYLATTAAVGTVDYNDWYVPNGSVGYYGVAFATLASWQTAAGGALDQNSVAVNPIFTNASTGNLLPANVVLNSSGTPLARVTDDITGAPRGAAPDLGAYEFNPITLDLLPAGLVTPAPGLTCYGTAEPVSVLISNGGTTALNFATNAATITVVVTPPTGAPQSFTTTLTTGTLASGATQVVALPGTLAMSTAGTYSFAITATVVGDLNTADDVLVPAATRTVLAPVAGTLTSSASDFCGSGNAGLTLTGAANGAIQFQSSSSATGPFADVAGATAASYITPLLTSTTYYRARVGCNASVVYSNIIGIMVTNPQLTATNSPLGVCAGATATLTATANAGSTVRFYTAATGGTALASATAGSYTTPALTASTTYYAAATTGGAEAVGPPALVSTGLTPNTGGAMVFTTTASFTLTSVAVYLNAGQAAGTVTVDLRVGRLGAAVQSTIIAVPAGPATGTAAYVIPLNYLVPAAGQYTLYLPSATQGGLLRDSSAPNLSYPFTSPSGLVSITGSQINGFYNYFYNWQINNECSSATRTPIQVIVSPAPTATLTAATQATGAVLLTAAPVAGATYQFFRNNQSVGAASTTNTLLLQSGALNGSYTVVVTSGGCASAPSAAVAVTVTGTRTASLNGVSLLVYPNPTPDGRLTLELTGPQAKAAQLEVLNALGQAVQRRPLAAGATTLSLAELAPGMYTLRVQTEQGILTQRVVRE